MLLRALDVSKRYLTRPLCDSVDFLLEAGDRVGLVGANGSGKTTFVRMLAGLEEPDHGRIERREDLELRYLPQDPTLPAGTTVDRLLREGQRRRRTLEAELGALHDELGHVEDARSVQHLLARQERLEERIAALGGFQVEHEIDALRSALQLPPGERSVESLSGGERRRVALAAAWMDRPDVLLLDEPTNHLDAAAIEWFEERLASHRGAFVLITHDRYLLDATVERMVELDQGRLHETRGGYAGYLEERTRRHAELARREHRRQAFLRRELEWIRRGPKARTTKAKARVQRFEDLRDVDGFELPAEVALQIPEPPRLGTKVVQVEHLRLVVGGRELVRDLSFELGAGERLGIHGPNGVGKTTLLRTLMGELEPQGGRVEVGSTVTFAYLRQQGEDLDPRATVLDAVANRLDYLQIGAAQQSVRAYLDQFLFPPETHETPVGRLSGGEQRRVQIARLLRERANVLVLDEATNDLDLPTLRVLEEALASFAGTILMVSHDRYFLDRVATRVLALDGRGAARDFRGTFAAWREREREERERAARLLPAAATRPAKPSASPDVRGEAKRLTYQESKELATLPARIEASESRLATLEERLADPALYRGKPTEEARRLQEEVTAARAELEAAYARWTELEERAS